MIQQRTPADGAKLLDAAYARFVPGVNLEHDLGQLKLLKGMRE